MLIFISILFTIFTAVTFKKVREHNLKSKNNEDDLDTGRYALATIIFIIYIYIVKGNFISTAGIFFITIVFGSLLYDVYNYIKNYHGKFYRKIKRRN